VYRERGREEGEGERGKERKEEEEAARE